VGVYGAYPDVAGAIDDQPVVRMRIAAEAAIDGVKREADARCVAANTRTQRVVKPDGAVAGRRNPGNVDTTIAVRGTGWRRYVVLAYACAGVVNGARDL